MIINVSPILNNWEYGDEKEIVLDSNHKNLINRISRIVQKVARLLPSNMHKKCQIVPTLSFCYGCVYPNDVSKFYLFTGTCSQLTNRQIEFIVLHEIGHTLFIPRGNSSEQAANEFAIRWMKRKYGKFNEKQIFKWPLRHMTAIRSVK